MMGASSPRLFRLARMSLGWLFVVCATDIAYRYGGGADAPRVARASAALVVKGAVAKGAADEAASGAPADEASLAYDVKLRFTETLGQAQVDAPNLRAALGLLAPHWRRMNLPFASLGGDAKKLAMSIALRTSDRERAFHTPIAGGGAWTPSARVWNMNEGSFDERESIFAPAPTTISYRISVPPNARFSFSAAMVNSANEDALFTVSIVDGGVERDVCSARVSAYQASTWHDTSCPLDAWGGHDVELRLKTAAVARDPHAPKPGREDGRRETGKGNGNGNDDEVSDAPLGTSIPLALWGHPTLSAKEPATVPYNVLWIVIDALRPDVAASFHDDAEDAKKRAAPHPPLDALLPKIDGLTPAIDDLARTGTRFMHAYSAATWTRPGTVAMLSGARSTEVGVDTLRFILPESTIARYYGSDPPLVSRILRKNGVATRAFVNNFFMAGYAAAGLDMGFERVSDYRYHTRDTAEITRDAADFIRKNAGDRFFLFCNYNSPHAPWEPPAKFLERIPPPPKGPTDEVPREYMAEAAKDDEAVGELVRALEEAHLRDRTLIIVTADHGETLSEAHAGTSQLDNLSVRFHHAAGNYEETSRIPILVSLPGVLPANQAVFERVRSIDIAPTVLDLEKLDRPSRMSGQSMLSLVQSAARHEVPKEDERVVLTEGRSTRGLIAGRYRLLLREGDAQTTKHRATSVTVAEELFDLEEDPGERKNIAAAHPDIVAEMRARLRAAEKNVAVVGEGRDASQGGTLEPLATPNEQNEQNEPNEPNEEGVPVHLRFAGKGAAHRVAGNVRASGTGKVVLRVEPVGLARDAFKMEGARLDFAFSMAANGVVGFDLRVEPLDAKLGWELYLDDRPWPDDGFFAGPLGVWEGSLRHGIDTDETRSAIVSRTLPEIDPARDLGLFVTRAEAQSAAEMPANGAGLGAGADEMSRMLRAWGYAHSSGSSSGAK